MSWDPDYRPPDPGGVCPLRIQQAQSLQRSFQKSRIKRLRSFCHRILCNRKVRRKCWSLNSSCRNRLCSEEKEMTNCHRSCLRSSLIWHDRGISALLVQIRNNRRHRRLRKPTKQSWSYKASQSSILTKVVSSTKWKHKPTPNSKVVS